MLAIALSQPTSMVIDTPPSPASQLLQRFQRSAGQHDAERNNDQPQRYREGRAHAAGHGFGCVRLMSTALEARANTAPIAEAPVTSPRLRDRLSMPETTPR